MELVIVTTAAFVVSAITLFSGFGLGTVLMPTFALFFPLPVAIAATEVVHLMNNLFKLGAFAGAYLAKRLLTKMTFRSIQILVSVAMICIGCGLTAGFI